MNTDSHSFGGKAKVEVRGEVKEKVEVEIEDRRSSADFTDSTDSAHASKDSKKICPDLRGLRMQTPVGVPDVEWAEKLWPDVARPLHIDVVTLPWNHRPRNRHLLERTPPTLGGHPLGAFPI